MIGASDDFRELVARSSLGCPNTPRCGRLLMEHEIADWDDQGDPIGAVCPTEPEGEAS